MAQDNYIGQVKMEKEAKRRSTGSHAVGADGMGCNEHGSKGYEEFLAVWQGLAKCLSNHLIDA